MHSDCHLLKLRLDTRTSMRTIFFTGIVPLFSGKAAAGPSQKSRNATEQPVGNSEIITHAD
jgi:hypothetical protein